MFLNDLKTLADVQRLVEFYVREHNTVMPHSAFEGQTPDEMYYGRGAQVPDLLLQARMEARQRRLKANRETRCGVCPGEVGSAEQEAA